MDVLCMIIAQSASLKLKLKQLEMTQTLFRMREEQGVDSNLDLWLVSS